MRRHFLSALLLSLTLSVSFTAAAQDTAGEAAMFAGINATRQAQQLPPLTRSPQLDAVARGHSQEMAQNGALAHVSDTTGSPEDRVRAAGLSSPAVAENVAMHRDAGQAQQALLASAPHLGNMTSTDTTHVGIGVVQSEQGVYVTQVFAALPAAPALPSVEATPVETAPEFGIIPPFVEGAVENVIGQAEATAAPVIAAPAVDPNAIAAPPALDPFGGAAEAPAAPTAQAPVAEAPVAEALPEAPVADAPLAQAPIAQAEAPADTAAASPQTIEVSPQAANSLQQLFNMGMSLLRGAPTAQ